MDGLEIYRNEDSLSRLTGPSSGDTICDYYTIVLHQSLNFTKCFIISNSNGELITYHEENNNLIIKKDGYKELIPEELTELAFKCIRFAVDNFKSLNYDKNKIACMGLCTHRNITIVWNKSTGKSLYNALAEDDTRCDSACQKLIQKSWRKSKTNFQHLCGLPISSKWAGVKLRWLLDTIGVVQDAYKAGELAFGTLDTWLLWQLTGGRSYATDVSSASYTMLMNLHRVSWDSSVCKFLELDPALLPEIRSCSEMFGKVTMGNETGVNGLPITGLICELKAALLGHQATASGSISISVEPALGRGHLTVTTGEELVLYRYMVQGTSYVLSTAAYQLGSKANVVYALEADLHNAQSLLPWFRDCLGLAGSTDDIDSVANSVTDSNGCYFISTSSGPSGRRRATVCGLDLGRSRPGHIVRAALDSVAIETVTLLDAISSVLPGGLGPVHVAGHGLAGSVAFCQAVADLSGLPVERLALSEPVIVGGALAAVLGANLDPSGLQSPIKERFSGLVAPGTRRHRCQVWAGLSREHELLEHRMAIGGTSLEDGPGSTGSLVGSRAARGRSGRYLAVDGRTHFCWRLLAVLVIGAPFSLIGFGTALLLSRAPLVRWPSLGFRLFNK